MARTSQIVPNSKKRESGPGVSYPASERTPTMTVYKAIAMIIITIVRITLTNPLI